MLSDVEAYEAAHGSPFDWNLKEVSEALGPLLHKVCKGSAGVKLKAVLKIDGFNAWRVLAFWFQARSTNDSISLLTMIMNPDRAKDLNDMMDKLDRWDALIRDCEMKFKKDDISDRMRQATLFAMAPEAVVENRLAGRSWGSGPGSQRDGQSVVHESGHGVQERGSGCGENCASQAWL